jgi:hypothetical protein
MYSKNHTCTKKLGVQTKRPKMLICYDFHSRIYDEKKDVMFAIELDLFSIGTMTIPTHIKHVAKPIYIPYIVIIELIPKQFVKSIGVLVVKLVMPPNIVQQHLPKTFFCLEVRKMIFDETPAQK